MKLSLSVLAIISAAILPAVQAICCSGAPNPGWCLKRELGGIIYAADTFIPAVLHERDIVVPVMEEVFSKRQRVADTCCWSAPTRDQCEILAL